MSEPTNSGQTNTDAAPAATATDAPATSATTQTAAPATEATPATAPAPATPESAPAPSAPEKYEFQAPEGVQFDAEILGKYSEVAKSLNLTQDAAQKVLSEVVPAMQAQSMKALSEFYKDIGGLPETWADQVKADKEIGGDKLNDTLAAAAKARDAFGGPELVKLLDKTGLGNNPTLIRAFAKIGKAISEDRFVGGSAPTKGSDPASKLYG